MNVVSALNVFVFENVLKSLSSVDEAAVPADASIYRTPDELDFRNPDVVVDSVTDPAIRLVVLAVMNDPYVVDDRANVFTPEK